MSDLEKVGGEIKNHGGKRLGSGRKAGTPNKTTAEIRALAQSYGSEALAELARLLRKGSTEAVRFAAAKEILDRAYGKAPQAITGEDGEGPIQVCTEVVITIVDPDGTRRPLPIAPQPPLN